MFYLVEKSSDCTFVQGVRFHVWLKLNIFHFGGQILDLAENSCARAISESYSGLGWDETCTALLGYSFKVWRTWPRKNTCQPCPLRPRQTSHSEPQSRSSSSRSCHLQQRVSRVCSQYGRWTIWQRLNRVCSQYGRRTIWQRVNRVCSQYGRWTIWQRESQHYGESLKQIISWSQQTKRVRIDLDSHHMHDWAGLTSDV